MPAAKKPANAGNATTRKPAAKTAAKPRAKRAPEGESKRDRFVRLVNHRTNNVLKAIDVLANCSNRNVYEYDHGDVERIFGAIEDRIEKARGKFTAQERNGGEKFTL